MSFPLPTIRKDGNASLVLSRCDCSLAQCVHALLVFPLFICQNSVSCYTSSGFLDQKSGRSTDFYLDHHKTVTTYFFSPWHDEKVSFRVNQRHCNLACLSWRVCFYAFLALHIPQPLTSTHIHVHKTPRWIHYSPVPYFPACSGFVLQFSAKGSGHLWGSIAPVCKPSPHPLSKLLHVPPAQPLHRQLQQEPNRWSLLPAGKRAHILPSCSWRDGRCLWS